MGEETDIHPDGKNYISHYELYVEAMKEVGADTSVVTNFVGQISNGADVHKELKNERIPAHVRSFVSNTLQVVDRSPAYVASQFFFGRESPIPQMFDKFIKTI